MKKVFVFLPLFFLVLSGKAEVKPFMDQMLNEIFNLKPYIVSPEAFSDPKNAQKIDASLKKMVALSVKINHEDKIHKTGFQISGKVLNQQLKEAQIVFNSGSKDYSLWMFKSTLGVCMSCHTQLPAVSTQFMSQNQSKVLSNPFEEAEFLFIIRNFKESMKLYLSALNGYPKNVVSADDLEKVLYRQLYYYVRVQRDLTELAKVLDEDRKNKSLPPHFISKVKGFKTAVLKMQDEKYPHFTAAQTAQLRQYVEKSLKEELAGNFSFDLPKRELEYLKVSSVLYEYLNENPETSLKPDILYWLSFCESKFSQQAFYSLPELYLKQCVMEFSKNPVAKKCLKEYQDLVVMAYSGSSGTHIPEDISKEMKTMQELVEKIK
ncbi:MAG TPA: hypothetical protein VIG33_14075 [Pseudobdellovibrionaceae bacterium]